MSVSQDRTPPTALFDAAAQAHNNARARRRQAQEARKGALPFLAERAIDDLADRLQDVNRTFARACLIGPFDWRDVVMAALPPGKIDALEWCEEPGGNDYDLVISLLHLQSVNAVGGWMQAVRAMLVPDGLCVAALIGGISLTEVRQALYAIDTDRLGSPTPRIHPMIEVRAAAQLLAHAGLAIPVTDSDRFTVRYRKLQTLAADLRDLGLGNALNDRNTAPAPALIRDLDAALRPDDGGPMPVSFELVWMTGWAPHKSQQKALKPGSAKTGLNTALRGIRDGG